MAVTITAPWYYSPLARIVASSARAGNGKRKHPQGGPAWRLSFLFVMDSLSAVREIG
jgi:hypothetical protein